MAAPVIDIIFPASSSELKLRTLKRRSYEAMGPINVNWNLDEPEPLSPGQVRMDKETDRLVRLFPGRSLTGIPTWTVEDVLSGRVYLRRIWKLGERVWTPLEVLAWAADEH